MKVVNNNNAPEGIVCGIVCVGACAVLCMPDGIAPILDAMEVATYSGAESGLE